MNKQKLLNMTAQIKSIIEEMNVDLNVTEIPVTPTIGFTKAKLADVADREAKKQLVWSPTDEAVKYTRAFEPWFGVGRFSWCAAFVTWCCNEAGLKVGIQPNPKIKGFEAYTWALVETWQKWAQENGYYYDNDGKYKPDRGAIVIFDWTQWDINTPDNRWQDHIGIHLSMSADMFVCAEGNTDDRTNIKIRPSVNIQGWVVLPDGLKSI